MATFVLEPATKELLLDKTNAQYDNEGNLILLSETNEELNNIAKDFLDVSLTWITDAGFAGPSLLAIDANCNAQDYLKELLCGRRIIQHSTIDANMNGHILHFITRATIDESTKNLDEKDKIYHYSNVLLPPGIPYRSKVITHFSSKEGLLHVTLYPKIALHNRPQIIEGKTGLFINGKKVDIDPQFAALYKLFYKHSAGIIPKEILTQTEKGGLFDEFYQLYIDEWGDDAYEPIKRLKEKVLQWNKNDEKQISRKIHRMIYELNNALNSTNDDTIAFHQVRQLHSKTKGAIYFLPQAFLNDIDIKLDTKGRKVP